MTLLCFQQAAILPVNKWFDTVVSSGDQVFHWGNITFDSIIEQVGECVLSEC